MNEPTPLGLAGSASLWEHVTSTYDLRADELRVLEDACREVDLIEAMQVELDAADSFLAKGSQGQPVAHPLVQELRQHRATLKSLLGSLKLPDEDGRAASSRSEQARNAARARWQRSA